jgi:hypothetical protein
LTPPCIAQSNTIAAFDEVHTAPPCLPTNALIAAVELMYVIGMIRPRHPCRFSDAWISSHAATASS